MPGTALRLDPGQFERLRKLIYDRSGIYFPDSKRYVLETRLTRRIEELGFQTFDEYLMFLTIGPYQMEEFNEMFNRITINETSFFRNGPQLEVFEKQVLPRLLEARKTRRTLRIWSAACSSGEEPFTLAIQVHRTLGVRLSDWRIEILGTDISQKVLNIAEGGRYARYSIRNTPPMVLHRYFKEVGGFYHIDPTIQSMVRFERLNLKDTLAARRFGTWDIIFCRNVLIYFDDTMKAQCARLFHDQLAEDGVLFIGHSESLRSVDARLENLPIPQGFAYQRSDT